VVQSLRQPLEDFIDRHVTSFTVWDLLVFLAQTEGPQTASGLSRRLGRPVDDIVESLEQLTAEGLLLVSRTEHGMVYRLSNDPQKRGEVLDFVQAIRSRDVRLQVLARLLRRGQPTKR
jgi:hypothetical protein